MLEIFLNSRRLDIFPDTEISYNIENPFVVVDKVPVPYTLDFSLPKTANNLAAMGQPERVSSTTNFNEARKVEVRFCGFVIISGELVIMEVNQEGVTVNITGANIPKNLTRKLYNHNLGELVVWDYHLDSKTIIDGINNHFTAKANEEMPDYVAAPCAIRGVEPVVADPDTQSDFYADKYTNQRCGMVNNYRCENGFFENQNTSSYSGYYCTSSLTGARILSKIIPAFRIGFLLKKILNISFSGNVFDDEFSRLMMLCNYHPAYQSDNDAFVGEINDRDRIFRIRFADFMPDIPANEFIAEILKLPCLTLFIKGSQYSIEFNRDILNDNRSIKMNLVDKFAISIEKGGIYKFAFASEAQQMESTDGSRLYEIERIGDVYAKASALPYLKSQSNSVRYRVLQSNQLFLASPIEELSGNYLPPPFRADGVHWKLQLLLQGAQQVDSDEDEDEDDEQERETFDISFNGSACRTVLVDYLDDDDSFKASFREGKPYSALMKLYVPELSLEKKDGKLSRGSQITLGLYHGIHGGVWNAYDESIKYPQISHCGYLPDGSKTTDIMLTPEYLVERYHKEYKAWVEKDKKVVTGTVILTPLELAQLDMRRKVHIDGRNFFIRTIAITLTNSHILPADAEFIES